MWAPWVGALKPQESALRLGLKSIVCEWECVCSSGIVPSHSPCVCSRLSVNLPDSAGLSHHCSRVPPDGIYVSMTARVSMGAQLSLGLEE